MTKKFSHPRHAAVIRKAIVAELRQAIIDKHFPPGTQIPAMRQLAEQYHVSLGSVQWAINQLVNEGWLSSCPGIGTIVNAERQELRSIGVFVYLNQPFGANQFQRLLIESLDQECRNRNLQMHLYYEQLQDVSTTRIKSEYARGSFQVAVILGLHETIEPAINKLTCPHVELRVAYAQCSFEKTALLAMRKAGVQRFVYCAMHNRSISQKIGEWLVSNCQQYGIDFVLDRDFIVAPQTVPPGDIELFQRYGYELFCSYWQKTTEKPDALLVFPDDTVPGILMAILALGIKVPQELKMFLHRNAERRLLCPVDCIFIENKIADYASQIISDCLAVTNHHPYVQQIFQYKCQVHKSTMQL